MNVLAGGRFAPCTLRARRAPSAMLGVLAAALTLAAGLPVASTARAQREATVHRRFLWSRSAQQDARGFYYQPAGLCDDFPEAERTAERLKRDFDAMRATGARVFRCGISWNTIEHTRGQYDWRFWDMLVAEAGRYGIELIPYVCYTPEWAARSDDAFWKQPPKDPALFGDFMRTISARYRSRVKAWELWNEPDNQDFWLGSVEDYARLLAAGAEGVRQGAPDAVTVLGGLALRDSPFFRDLLTKYRASDLVDVVNIHNYDESWDDNRLEAYTRQIEAVADRMRAAGDTDDLWMAEFGYASYRYAPNQASSGGTYIAYDYEHTPEYQAVALFKAHVLALATGKLSLTAWYRINDLPPSVNVIGDDVNRHLGILTVDGKPKPAYHALRYYARLFGQATRCIDDRLGLILPPRSQSVVHAFELRDGTVVVTGWLRSPTRREVADTSGMARDTRREAVTITLPSGEFGDFGNLGGLTVTDAQGRRRPTRAVWKNGRLSGIVLKGGEVFVARLVRKAAAAPVPPSTRRRAGQAPPLRAEPRLQRMLCIPLIPSPEGLGYP